ncbi:MULTISPECIES: hypothetical protein [unclassified Polaribacter]|uniref:hypothetical protein n=1 Tax=unclassified Polaribacter TaxID=196858 RepID=UPI0011BFE227|nr:MULTISPECIES: hypothetical protein [unclassified Polaribacter]TXD50696.1 hypothetical protein ES043_15255 [Polaribacter sp. IC063]TXD58409.1 hypothetical protein ES044_12225 [Polaribacter sp. IC066]
MKKIILILLALTLTSCVSLFLNKALEKIGVFDEKAKLKSITNNKKSILFIGMHHIGRKEFYKDVAIKVDSLQEIGYVVFFEKVKKNTSNDSLTNDLYKKKIRKITGLKTFKYYDTINNIIFGKIKYKGEYKLTNQPKYPKLNVNMSNAVNADVEIKSLLKEFENKYGEIELSACDIETASNSTEYDCAKIDSDLAEKFSKEFIIDFRNQYLANKINNSKENKILIIYGKGHFEGITSELKSIDSE